MKQADQKRDWLIGKWEYLDNISNIVFEIIKAPRGLRITAFDNDDGEKLTVSKIKWNGRVLKFETYTASTKWRTKNVLIPVSKTKVVQELTLTCSRSLTPAKDP